MTNNNVFSQKLWIFDGLEEGRAVFRKRFHVIEIDGSDIRIGRFDRSAYFNAIKNNDGTESLPEQVAYADLDFLKTVETFDQLRAKPNYFNNQNAPVLLPAIKQQALRVLEMHHNFVAAPRLPKEEPALVLNAA